MDKFCEDCIHNEVCQYGAIPPHIGRCNDKDTLDDLIPRGEWKVKTLSTFPQYQPDEYECPFWGLHEERRCGMRLIDADALKEKYQRYCRMYGLKPIWKFIDNAPTVKSYTFEDLVKAKNNGYKWGRIDGQATVRTQGKWIPVSERLPDDLEHVNITWINHNPEPYYKEIKDKPFTATGVYFNGQWYWWSTLCTDILAEYSNNFDDVIDADIEVIAWQPLPEPYKKGGAK